LSCLFSNHNCAPSSQTEVDDAAFPSLVASYRHPSPIFPVRASEGLACKPTRKGIVRGAANGRGGEAFSIPAAEGSEADRSEGLSKGQKEKARGGSDRPGWPGRASRLTSEPDHRRGKLGSRRGRMRAASLLGGRVKRLNSGGWAA
jgi:hypothetical protein